LDVCELPHLKGIIPHRWVKEEFSIIPIHILIILFHRIISLVLIISYFLLGLTDGQFSRGNQTTLVN
jgi:hypothetical protein